jgi:hypothetical protein
MAAILTKQQLQAFVRKHALSPSEVDHRLSEAQNAAYWRSLCSEATVGNASAASEASEIWDELGGGVADYWERGYLSLKNVFNVTEIERLKQAVYAIRQAGWPLIFALVYDQFWTLIRSPRLSAILRELLGAEHQITHLFWVHYVHTARGAAGFPPHQDGGCGFHTTSCWIPLSPATLDNGCMYVIERSLATENLTLNFAAAETYPKKQVHALLHHAQALPAEPGGLLAWQHTTPHWGGRFRHSLEPRLAVSWEFTQKEYEPKDPRMQMACDPTQPLPSLDHRLRWISMSLLGFRGREVVVERFVPLAQRILA